MLIDLWKLLLVQVCDCLEQQEVSAPGVFAAFRNDLKEKVFRPELYRIQRLRDVAE